MIRILLLSSLLCSSLLSQAQYKFVKSYLNYTLNDTSAAIRPKYIVYPTIAFAPETSWEFGLSNLLVYRAKQDTTNRLSEIKAFSFVTLANQYGTKLDHALYTDKNKYFFLGKGVIENFPLLYYGIGGQTESAIHATVNTVELRLRERVLRQIYPSLFTGFEVDFQRLSNINIDYGDYAGQIPKPRGADGSQNLALGWGVLYDNIENTLNPRHGTYAEIAYLASQRAWGSTFTFESWFLDVRKYHQVRKRNVFATQLYGQFTNGQVPFNEMALMGGDELMRGYYYGRFRDYNLVGGQFEYRMLPFKFAKRWGASVFLSTAKVFPDMKSFNSSSFKIAGGFGPRFLIFPKKDVYTRLDFGFTEEGTGYYFFIGEAF